MQQEIFVLEGGGKGDEINLGGEGGLDLVDGAVLYVEKKPKEGAESSLKRRFEMEVQIARFILAKHEFLVPKYICIKQKISK